MSDLSISQKFNMPIATPQFRSSNTTPITSVPQKENKGLSTGAKVAIGTGLVALASYGIYVATRGKVKPKTTPPVTTNNPVQEIKELAVSAFKEAGNKFVKGKAVMADGTNYTGKIVSEGKDGSKVVMEYLDGVLQKSTKTKGAETIFEKTYKYSDELGLEQVIKNNNTTLKKFIDEAGNLNIKTPEHITIIHKPSGLISIDGRFIDKQKNISGYFQKPTLAPSREGGINYPIKIKGAEISADNRTELVGAFDKGTCTLNWKYTGEQNNNKFFLDNTYYFNTSGQSKRDMDLRVVYGEYKKLYYDFKTGSVSNGDTPLFNFNYRTNEITDLKIDKKEAEELVNFAKEQYRFYQKAQKARLREYAAGSC